MVVIRLLPGTYMSPHSMPVTAQASLKQGFILGREPKNAKMHLEVGPTDTRGCCKPIALPGKPHGQQGGHQCGKNSIWRRGKETTV